ncbi:hypothetical protein ACFVHW_31180 [Streptomyces sp. NPDC127110]|uniref:hypothetical protein n=1 Tax=Streptomyces sp. NPDC127110 TaxID=3345362 RepID=UPI003628546C
MPLDHRRTAPCVRLRSTDQGSGKFTRAMAMDRFAGDGVEAVLAPTYDEYEDSTWSHTTSLVAVVDTTRLLNCKAAW